MSRGGLLLLQMDEVYARLRRRLEGLTDEEYLWEPVPGCWTIHRDRSGAWVSDYAEPDPQPPWRPRPSPPPEAPGPLHRPGAPAPAVSAGLTPSAARSADLDQRDAHQQEPRPP
jgi:hypothetical protein